MIQNIVAIGIIAAWVAATIYLMIHDYKKAKREGTPMACLGCGAYGHGSCDHHCPSEAQLDDMVARAKERLQATRSARP